MNDVIVLVLLRGQNCKLYNGQSPGVSWLLRIMFATSMPSSVAEADVKDLNPGIGRMHFLIER